MTPTAATTRPSRNTSAVTAIVGVVAALGALAALLVHSACVDPGPPVARPEPGTPRAGYCGVMHGVALWMLLTVAPTLVIACASAMARGRVRWWLALLALLCAAAALANVFIVDSLGFAYTI